jgi:8-oxo-dGTP pyrophosphatase MutT (NUDIX family)
MELPTREAALCIIRRGATFLVAEIRNDERSEVLHRPPGGGVEPGETPEQAVRRELEEELRITLEEVTPLGFVNHTWFCDGREVNERAWLFLADASIDARLNRGECPTLMEADGQCLPTFWRSLEAGSSLPEICPSALPEVLAPIFS